MIRTLRNVRYLSGGPLGVDGRAPFISSTSSALSITDPFIIYQNYVKLGILQPDEIQLRTMKHFQRLYERLLDYKSPEEMQIRINLVLKQLKQKNLKSPVDRFLKVLDKKLLIRIITDEEELEMFTTPQGLLLNGEVGCGKSLLMDIFALSLPQESKMRWHYHNFMLWVYTEMHRIQCERLNTKAMRRNIKDSNDHELILFEIAQKMITKNTVLILDEFMLPDIASANIIKILFTLYFKLGGVLVATSNKLPDELYANEFNKLKFKSFVNILHLRCEQVEMNSTRDYRVLLSGEHKNLSIGETEKWNQILQPLIPSGSSAVIVYSRKLHVPKTYNNHTICMFDFSEICQGEYASSDYISLTSKYQTIIIDNVPIMTMNMKNEAKRFISLLDALYESKCQLYMRVEVDLEYLFFPDVFHKDNLEIMQKVNRGSSNNIQVQEEEMYAKTRIDLESPYRPNVSSYDTNETYVEQNQDIDYKNLTAFTGEDEQFAYKRAILRIIEMVGSPRWSTVEWVPIDETMRPWESPTLQLALLDMEATEGRHKLAPQFSSLNHFWAMGNWTSSQGKRLKDGIAKSWIRLSVRN